MIVNESCDWKKLNEYERRSIWTKSSTMIDVGDYMAETTTMIDVGDYMAETTGSI